MNIHRKFTAEIQTANKHEKAQSPCSQKKCKLKEKRHYFPHISWQILMLSCANQDKGKWVPAFY